MRYRRGVGFIIWAENCRWFDFYNLLKPTKYIQGLWECLSLTDDRLCVRLRLLILFSTTTNLLVLTILNQFSKWVFPTKLIVDSEIIPSTDHSRDSIKILFKIRTDLFRIIRWHFEKTEHIAGLRRQWATNPSIVVHFPMFRQKDHFPLGRSLREWVARDRTLVFQMYRRKISKVRNPTVRVSSFILLFFQTGKLQSSSERKEKCENISHWIGT